MTEQEATVLARELSIIAANVIDTIDKKLRHPATYEDKMNIFMGFMAQLIEVRGETI